MNILISSTSFIMPKHNSWNSLQKKNKLKFAEYGNLFSNNLSKNEDLEIKILFLNDIIDYYSESKKDLSKNILRLKNIAKSFQKNFLSNRKYIICISSYQFINIVNFSQSEDRVENLKKIFLEELKKKRENCKNIFLVDLDKIFSIEGYKKIFDARNYELFRSRLSLFGIEILSNNLQKLIDRISKTNKKVLLLDCDNTLWGGVIGEDGIENIKIGQDGIGNSFKNFQKAIKKIQGSGILLAVISKNNEKDVKNVFKLHKEMVLKEKDIINFKINWKDKSKNIVDISNELNLSLDSFVVWDDNPLERKKIRINCKEVEVIEPAENVSDWSNQLLETTGLTKFNLTKEDKDKTHQYHQRAKFVSDKEISKNELSYLKSIKIKPKVIEIDKDNISRAQQLCEKTNQFNTTFKRYSLSEIKKIKQKDFIKLVSLKDLYGDHGIVGLIHYQNDKKNKNIKIVLFLLSCRILGRYLENWILNFILKEGKKKRFENVIISYTKGLKNSLALDFIKKNKFKLEKKKRSKNKKNYFEYIRPININVENLNIYE